MESMVAPAASRTADDLFDPLGVQIRRPHERLHGHLASRCAEIGDVVQQAILGVRGQIAEQSFGDPGGRSRRLESAPQQRGRPVVAQVGRYHPQTRRRLGTQLRQRFGLELQHIRLIDLIHRHPGRPRQSVAARVEAGRQDHRLADPGGCGVLKELIEVAGAGHQLGGHSL